MTVIEKNVKFAGLYVKSNTQEVFQVAVALLTRGDKHESTTKE